MASIRVSQGHIPIEVNDKGDTIELRTDADFLKECLRLQHTFKESKDAYDKVLDDPAATLEQQEAVIDQMFQATDSAIDQLFGAGSCDKIFPPKRNAQQYGEFFDQLTDIIVQQQKSKVSDKYAKRVK